MKRLIGYLLLGLGFIMFWPLEVVIVLSGLAYIIRTFLDAGVVAGLISIPIVGVILGVISYVIFAIKFPLAALAAALLEKKRPQSEYEEILETRRKEWEMASPEKRFELEWRNSQWYRYMEEGFSAKEADEKARQLNYDSVAPESEEESYKHSVREIYSREWAKANGEKRVKLDKRMHRWQELMMNGLTAREAYHKAIDEELKENS